MLVFETEFKDRNGYYTELYVYQEEDNKRVVSLNWLLSEATEVFI